MNKIILMIFLIGILFLSSCGNSALDDNLRVPINNINPSDNNYLSSKGANGISSMNCALVTDEEVTRLCSVVGGEVKHSASSSRTGSCDYGYYRSPDETKTNALNIFTISSVDNFANIDYEAGKHKKTAQPLNFGNVEAKFLELPPINGGSTKSTMIVFKRIIDNNNWVQHFLIQGETLASKRPESLAMAINYPCAEGGLEELARLASSRPLSPEAYEIK